MYLRPSPVILVVEDEPFVRSNAVEMIEEGGWNALEAGDAGEALRILSDHPEVDVLFTDINMPGPMNGLELAEHVHREFPHVELIVTSGKRTLSDAALPDDGTFLPKPYGLEDVQRTIASKVSPSA